MSNATKNRRRSDGTGGPMGGGPMHMGPVQKAKDFKGTMKKLVWYAKPYWIGLIVVLFCAVAGQVFSIVGPKILSRATNKVIEGYVQMKVYDGLKLPEGIKAALPKSTTVGSLKDEMPKLAMKPIGGMISPYAATKLPKTVPLAILFTKPDQLKQMVAMMKDPRLERDVNTFIKQMDDLKKMQDQKGSMMGTKVADNLKEAAMSVSIFKRPSIDLDAIAQIVVQLVILYLVSAIFSAILGWVMTSISQKIIYRFRNEISEKIDRVPLKYFDSQARGDILSRITNDVETLSQNLNQSIAQTVVAITAVIGVVIMMFTISWQMTIVALVILPVSGVLIGAMVKKSQKFFKMQQETLGELDGHIEEMFSGHHVMKVYGGKKRSIETFRKHNKALYGSAWKSQFYSGLMFPIMFFIGNLGYVAVSVIGGYLAINGKLLVGDIQAFIQYVQMFNQPVSQAAQIATMLQSTAAAAERVFAFLEEKELSPDPQQPVQLLHSGVKGQVVFDNVVFGYDEDKTIIKGFSATIEPGMRVAIVGPTGAGKTTMVNLLMRFYEVGSGSIKVDGVDIRDMTRQDVAALFGMVLQDTWLFNGTIKENIAYGKPDATMDEIVAAAKAAHADHFIHALPDGYNMEINEEASNISQGQKQLLTIARAMLENAPMMILDEATSNVDTRTEVIIQKAMEKLMHGRTCFVIAHRLSTIRDADLILVMQDGNIVEQGNHQQLLEQKGFYASLYNSQFENAQGISA